MTTKITNQLADGLNGGITKYDEPKIQEWLNCQTADVDSEGDVWVEGPMRGHWLSPGAKVDFVNWRDSRGMA